MFLFAFPLFAQLNTGRISGAVTDQTGGAIAGATVTITNVATNVARPLVSDGAGQYAAPNLDPGTYTVRAEFKGFQAIERQNVQVGVGGDVRVDLSLQPGEQTQTVTVTESIPIVNTTNAQTGGALENQLLTNLPINGRNYRWMISVVPGVLLQPGEGTASEFVNGAPGEAPLNVMVDGLYDESWFDREINSGGASEAGNTTLMPLDAIQEVNLVVNPKAEYGWVPGLTVSVGLKSGTNNLHGSAYAFGRGTDFDARNAFSFTPAGQPYEGPISFEQFGATVGGPIKKNKIFYFLGFEGLLENLTSTATIITPTTADLGAASTETSESFPGAIAAMNVAGVPLSELSLNLAGCNVNSAAIHGLTGAAVAPACATGNQYGATGLFAATTNNTNYATNTPDIGRSDNGLAKVNYQINDHHAINGSYYIGDYFEQAAGNSPAKILQPYWEEVLGVLGQDARAAWIWTPNASWLNEARVGWDHGNRPVGRAECAANGNLANSSGVGASTGGYGGPNYLTDYGMDQNAPGCGIPTITLASPLTTQLGFSNGRVEHGSDDQFADSLSYTRGTHQFKFGVDVRAESFTGAKVLDSQTGVIAFGGSGAIAFTGATSLEDFLAGVPSSETIRSGSPIRSLTTNLIGMFAQDDWRILPRLTLNIGVREEVVTPPTDSASLVLGNFDPTQPSGMDALNQTWKTQDHISPRIGFAWDITGKGTTTVRASYGVANDFEKLMDFVSGGGSGNYDSVPTGAKLFYANGTPGPAAPGNGTSAFLTLTPVSTNGVVTSSPIIWPLTNSATTPLFPSPIPVECGNGLPIDGSGTTVTPLNPVNPSPCAAGGGNPNLQYYHYQFWNLNVQHAFTNNLSLDVGYVGSHSSGIIQSVNLNQAPPTDVLANATPSSELARATYVSQFPWFSTITYDGNSGTANYASLQMALVERAAHGLIFSASYTFSHALESAAPLNIHQSNQNQYGNAAFDIRDHFTITSTYDIPGRKSPGQMLEGWSVNASVNIESGLPYTPSDTTDDLSGAGAAGPWTLYGSPTPFDQAFGRAGTIPCYGVAANAGLGIKAGTFAKAPCVTVAAGSAAAPWANMPAACIAAATGEASYTTALAGTTSSGSSLEQLATIGCYMVNGSAMVAPAQGTYGDMTPGELRGAGLGLLNASAVKNWKLKERYTIEFRAEAFNLLNRTQYSVPGVNIGSPKSFGLATSTPDVAHGEAVTGSGGPRALQLGLKLLF